MYLILLIANMVSKQEQRKAWMIAAIDGAKLFSGKDFTNEQEVGILAQFSVLMDQIDIAVEALQKISDGNTYCESAKYCDDCKEVAKEALKRMKS